MIKIRKEHKHDKVDQNIEFTGDNKSFKIINETKTSIKI